MAQTKRAAQRGALHERMFPEIIRELSEGCSADELCRRQGYPSRMWLHRHVQTDAGRRAQYHAALDAGKRSGKKRVGKGVYRKREDIVEAIAQLPDMPMLQNQTCPNGIALTTIAGWCRGDTELMSQFRDSIYARNARIEAQQTEERERRARLRKLARKPEPSRYDLLRSLFENELYKRADAIVGKSDEWDADDLRSDAIVAMLEGRETNRQSLMRNHWAVMERNSFRSLNDLLTDDRDTAFVDTITTSDILIDAVF